MVQNERATCRLKKKSTTLGARNKGLVFASIDYGHFKREHAMRFLTLITCMCSRRSPNSKYKTQCAPRPDRHSPYKTNLCERSLPTVLIKSTKSWHDEDPTTYYTSPRIAWTDGVFSPISFKGVPMDELKPLSSEENCRCSPAPAVLNALRWQSQWYFSHSEGHVLEEIPR